MVIETDVSEVESKMFFKRLFSTVILLAIFSCIIFGEKMFGSPLVSKISFLIFGGFLSFFVPYETGNMLKQAGKPVFVKLTSTLIFLSFLIGYALLFFSQDSKIIPIIGFSAFFLILFALPWIFLLFIIGKEGGLERILNSCGVAVLFILPFFLIQNIYFNHGAKAFLFFVIGTKIGDIGAYVTGTLSNKIMKGGNHKMIPSISPGKSWEGTIGGLLISIIFSVSLYGWAFPELKFGIWLPIVLGTVLFIFGAAGDLAESCIKRVCKIKDSGHTLPGIGGVFDLVDSLMLNSLVFTLFLIFCKFF